MDEFLQDIYKDVIWQWLLGRFGREDAIHVHVTRHNEYCRRVGYDTEDCEGRITLWYNGIVEERIARGKDVIFYLHFRFTTMNRFLSLYEEFAHCLRAHTRQSVTQIGIMSNDGLSAAMFVRRLSDILTYESADFEIRFIGTEEFAKSYDHLDAVYLAPQLIEEHPHFMMICHNRLPVYDIDPTVYATKDAHTMINTIRHNQKARDV